MRIFVVIAAIFSLMTAVASGAGTRSLARYTTDDAILFVEVRDLELIWYDIVSSNFWNEFTALSVLEKSGINDKISNFMDEFQSMTGIILSRTNVMSLLGKKFAISIYAEPDPKGGPIKIEVVFIAECNIKKTVDDMMSILMEKAREKMGNEASYKTIVYNNRRIHSVTPKAPDLPVKIRYTYDKDIIIIGVGNIVPRIEKFLDCSTGGERSLETLPRYLEIKTITMPMYGDPFLSIYADLEKITAIKNTVREEDLDILAGVDRFCQLFGTGGTIGATWMFDNGIKSRTIITPASKGQSVFDTLKRSTKPSLGTTWKYIPKETMLYFAMNEMPNAVKMYPEVLKIWQADPRKSFMAQFIEQIELTLDIEVRADILSFIDNEIALLYEGVETEKYDFPMPKIALMIKMRDKAKAAAFTNKLIKAIRDNAPEGFNQIELKQYDHEGMKIFAFELINPVDPHAEKLRPCYVFMDDFLVLASSLEQVKSMISVSKGRSRGLLDSAVYKATGIPTKTNHLVFVNWNKITENADAAVDWFVHFAGGTGYGDDVQKSVKEHVRPIIRILSVVRSFSSYTINTPQGIETNSYIKLDDISDM